MLSKEQEEQRKEMLNKIDDMVRKGQVVPLQDKFPEDCVITCMAIEDDDYKKINEWWALEANKSYPREVFCSECKRQVMMSNSVFKMYQEAEKKPKVVCGKCLQKVIHK
jgi:DNA-directed RNA polymerase subunit RPC12/RpoP